MLPQHAGVQQATRYQRGQVKWAWLAASADLHAFAPSSTDDQPAIVDYAMYVLPMQRIQHQFQRLGGGR